MSDICLAICSATSSPFSTRTNSIEKSIAFAVPLLHVSFNCTSWLCFLCVRLWWTKAVSALLLMGLFFYTTARFVPKHQHSWLLHRCLQLILKQIPSLITAMILFLLSASCTNHLTWSLFWKVSLANCPPGITRASKPRSYLFSFCIYLFQCICFRVSAYSDAMHANYLGFVTG